MKITKTITINRSADELWHLIAHQFDQAHLWMGPIPNSKALGPGTSDFGAPMQGRICDLSENPQGAQVKEIITQYNEENKTIAFDVLPINNPAIVPIKQNHVAMSVRAVSANTAEVSWTASPQLKTFALLFYPLLRMIFPVAFGKLLQGLKDYAESQPTLISKA